MTRQDSLAPPTTRRPRVVVSATVSVDGRLTLRRDSLLLDQDTARVWHSVQPPGAQRLDAARSALLAELYGPQAVLEGSGTFVTDDAGPRTDLPTGVDIPAGVLHTDHLPGEVVERPGHRAWFAVVDGRGRVRWTTTSDGEFDLLVLVSRATPPEYLAHLRREKICYLVAGTDRVDLPAALVRLRERLAITCVVSNAGGGLNGALLRAGLVDEVQLLVLPAVVGGQRTPSVFDGPELAPGAAPTRLRLVSSQVEDDGTLWLRYEVRPGTER